MHYMFVYDAINIVRMACRAADDAERALLSVRLTLPFFGVRIKSQYTIFSDQSVVLGCKHCNTIYSISDIREQQPASSLREGFYAS